MNSKESFTLTFEACRYVMLFQTQSLISLSLELDYVVIWESVKGIRIHLSEASNISVNDILNNVACASERWTKLAHCSSSVRLERNTCDLCYRRLT